MNSKLKSLKMENSWNMSYKKFSFNHDKPYGQWFMCYENKLRKMGNPWYEG